MRGGLVALLLPLVALGGGILNVTVPDASIERMDATPSGGDPGPVMHSGSDGLTFSTDNSNAALAWYAELVSVRNNASETSGTIQGSAHTFGDWFYAKQGGATRFATLNATGTYDPDAASYTVPLLFIKSSQGTVALTSYDGNSPTTPTTTAYHWAYNAVTDRYVFGPDKNLASAAQVAPVSNTLGTNYAFTLESNGFVVTAMGGAGQYVPTITQGHHFPFLSLPATKTWYLMMDTPPGVTEDTYTYTLRVTGTGV